jgi:hypothetical protein
VKITLTHPEAAVLAALLRPRVDALQELLVAQIESLPPGDDGWCRTEDQLHVAAAALRKVEGLG